MTRPEPKGLDTLKIGDMPQPVYLLEAQDTTGHGDIKWIGMKAYAPNRQVKDFLFWRTFDLEGNLSDERARYSAASFIARLKLEHEADAAIGLPIDLAGSNQEKNYVSVIERPNMYGIYIEAAKRPIFNFMVFAVKGIRSEAQLRRSNPVEFDRIFQQARDVLPYDKQ